MEVDADLIGASGFGPGFQQRGAIPVAAEDRESGDGRQAIGLVDGAGSEFPGFRTDGSLTDKIILRGMALHPDQIVFFNFTAFELRLHNGRKMAGAADHDHTGGIGIQTVRRAGFLRMPGGSEVSLGRVSPLAVGCQAAARNRTRVFRLKRPPACMGSGAGLCRTMMASSS